MSEENRIRFAGLMEAYLNIPSFVCELIEKQLQDNKYKEVIEYIVQRRNEIENKKDYLSEQEKIKRYLDLQQKVEQLENIRKEAIKTIEEDILGKKIENVNWDYDECYYSDMPVERVKHLLNILNKGENNE